MLNRSLAYKPFSYPWAVEYAVAHEKTHWGEWEAKLADDLVQWKSGSINDSSKAQITQILRLFTQSDVAVGTNYLEVYIPAFKNNEIRAMLTSFANREFVHQRAYALLNDTLGLPEEDYSVFREYNYMKDKLDYMADIDGDNPTNLGHAVARTIMNEGMSLFSAFVILLNYQRFGKMKGMCEIVEWSIRDESLHCEGMVKLFRELCNEYPEIVTDDFKFTIYESFRTMVEMEDAVIDAAFYNGASEGLSKEEVKLYIRYLADRRLIQMGLKGNFKVKENPLPWLDWVVNGNSHKNFFEGVVTDYNADGMSGTDWGW